MSLIMSIVYEGGVKEQLFWKTVINVDEVNMKKFPNKGRKTSSIAKRLVLDLFGMRIHTHVHITNVLKYD